MMALHMQKIFSSAIAALLLLGACAQAEIPRKPPRSLTNEQGCSITIDNQPLNAYQEPSPIEQACIGPYLLELPQNYFSTQMGPQHDGSFSLALEYPSLEPFKPGERMNLSVDVAARTVRVNYSHIRNGRLWEVMRNRYTPWIEPVDAPQKSLDARIRGELVHGLEPYYIDMDKVRAYYRENGLPETASVMEPTFHHDWFVSRDVSGRIDQLIECTPRQITESGVEYRDGKMVKKRVTGFAGCKQHFVIEELDVIVLVEYPREGLTNWERIRQRARALLIDNIKE